MCPPRLSSAGHALPHMLARGGGTIVNIGSMSGMQNERGFLPYSLAKSALGKFTQLAAIELAPRIRGKRHSARLRRNRGVCVGFMDAMPDVREGLRGKKKKKKLRCARNGTPDDIALCRFIFSLRRASSWITGKLLEVDGRRPGRTLSEQLTRSVEGTHVSGEIRFDGDVVIVTGAAGGNRPIPKPSNWGRCGARVVVNDLGGSPAAVVAATPTMAQSVADENRRFRRRGGGLRRERNRPTEGPQTDRRSSGEHLGAGSTA